MLKNYFFIVLVFACTSVFAQSSDSLGGPSTPLQETISVLPNPAKNMFQIKGVESAATLRVYSVLGKKVKEIKSYFGQEVNVQNMRSGIYLVHIEMSDRQSITRKLIVE